jgi:hypothetical protein
MTRWKEALALSQEEVQRTSALQREADNVRHECDASLRSMLEGSEFSGARRFFFFWEVGSMICLHLKIKGFWAMVPTQTRVSYKQFLSLEKNITRLEMKILLGRSLRFPWIPGFGRPSIK